MILRNYANSTEILTSNSTLRRLTRNGSRSQLTDYLRQNCATAFSLGWGVGLNVLQAQQNANRILNRLTELGAAVAVGTEQSNSAGPSAPIGWSCKSRSPRKPEFHPMLCLFYRS